jgi:hypothetical protein
MGACSYQPYPPRIRVVLRERSSRGNGSSERTPRKTPPDCYLRAAAWQRTQEKNAPTLCWAAAIVTHPKKPDPKESTTSAQQQKMHMRINWRNFMKGITLIDAEIKILL